MSSIRSAWLALTLIAGCSAEVVDRDDRDEVFASVSSALRAVNGEPLKLSYTGTTSGTSSACDKTRELLVFEPTDATPGEKFPVLIATIGLGAKHTANDAKAIAREAARRGYVAASMEYANESGLDCVTVDQRAKCSYDPTQPNSATKVLCSRPLADCSRGIVTAGHSLGGALAVRAKNFDARVRAAFTIGTANGNGTQNCMNPGPADGGTPPRDRKLRNSEWLLFAGESEFPENTAAARSAATGKTCAAKAGTIDCRRTDGSGWYQVADSEALDVVSDHCYQLTGGTISIINPRFVQSCNQPNLDPTFLSGTKPWSLGPAIDFLSSRVDPCDHGVTAGQQIQNGRVTLTEKPFFNNTTITALQPVGDPNAPAFIVIGGDNARPFDSLLLVQQALATEVSMRQTAPGVFALCEPEKFPPLVFLLP